MKVLMFGWEFPPISSGGLGTACEGLTKGLNKKGIAVTFVLPKSYNAENPGYLNIISTEDIERVGSNIKVIKIDSPLQAYTNASSYNNSIKNAESLFYFGKKRSNNTPIYGENLFDEVERYAQKSRIVAQHEDFDVIHAHDWMTYRAGINAKQEKNKPLVIHVHATEFDRTGGNPNLAVYNIEREGMHAADKIIAVSNFTKNKIVEHYGVPESKITVVHNAVDLKKNEASDNQSFYSGNTTKNKMGNEKVVLFLGRVTLQKGPDYFLYAAKKALEFDPDIKFVISGTGDMMPFIIEKAAELGISKNVLFTGFLSGEDVDKAYRMADLYVMPSVSEPFGITPLEAMRNGVPALISKQSGVSEVLHNCLKVDFWDINETANKMIAALNYGSLHKSLKDNGTEEVMKFSWENSAEKCINVYNNAINGMSSGFAG